MGARGGFSSERDQTIEQFFLGRTLFYSEVDILQAALK